MGMISFTVLKSSADAKRYYSPSGHDYWIEDRNQRAFFGGKLAERLGLDDFSIEAFHDLCDGIIPNSRSREHPDGVQITPGKKDNKRAGWDITVSGCKDLGVLMALGLDERIVPQVLERAGRDVMALIERDAQTRVRMGGQDTDRTTGEIVYTGVLHTTARPVAGKIDFQPHYHFVVANATYDPVEQRYKALQLQPFSGNGAKEARPHYTAFFNNQLARYMRGLGYEIEKTPDSFRVVGVPEAVVKEFSQRTNKIEAVAAMLEKQKQAFLGNPDAKLKPEVKGRLGAHTRERKQPGKTWESLLAHWASRVTLEEHKAIHDTVDRSRNEPMLTLDRSREAVDWSLRHLLERSSVVSQRQVVTEALKHGIGQVTPEGIYAELGSRKDLIRRKLNGVEMVSTQGVLSEEKRILQFAVKGRGRFKAMGRISSEHSPRSPSRSGQPDTATPPAFGQAEKPESLHDRRPVVGDTPPLLRDLSATQQAAVRHVWTSPDRLILIRGAAGTGKTTLTKAALAGVNVPWVILAPSAEASRGVLRRDGFSEADTLSRFLVDDKFQEQARNGLIWLDEASLAGAHDLAKLTQLADQLNARIVLSGDRRQHKSVARGDVLALLEDKAGLPVAEVSEIRRQSGEYKQAVELLAKGKVADGFQRLDRLGWVKEANHVPDVGNMVGPDHVGGINEMIAEDYLAALQKGQSVLVIDPTHASGEKVTAAIREKLKQDGRLKGEERTFERLVPLHLTEAERAAGIDEVEGLTVQFHRSAGAYRAGERRRYGDIAEARPPAAAYSVYRDDRLTLADGDAIRITANGKSLDGHRLNNGSTYTVAGFTDKDDIKLNNGWVIGKDFAHVAHGYVVTSHSSQGRTVDVALVAMGNESLGAMGAEQFYVSASRARQQTKVYVEDRSAVLDAIQRDDSRMLASDLVRQPRTGLRQRIKRHLGFLRKVATLGRDREPTLQQQPEIQNERI